MNKLILLLLTLFFSSASSAEAIDMRDYIRLRNGMTEAEVLYRFGPCDHETVRIDRYDAVLEKTWFYIPGKNSTIKWITEIQFDSKGRITNLDRYKVK